MNETRLLVATHNPGKAGEYAHLLADLPLVVTWLDEIGITDSVEETGDTFEENALLKARYYAQRAGMLTWADDSGLEIDALDGRPGVYSARYGGPNLSDRERYEFVLRELVDTPDVQRTARFRCVIAVARPDGQAWTVAGAVEGRILAEPRGHNGFGYDPIFFVPDFAASMAELPAEVKNQISHRAVASATARQLLAQEFAETGAV